MAVIPTTAAPPPTETAATWGVEKSSLYVGDLQASVDEIKLFNLFNRVAPVVSVRVCRDYVSLASLGYGYVNFRTAQDASKAREVLNFKQVNGKQIRIMFSQRDPTPRKSGFANVFVKNLDSSIDNKALYVLFTIFGEVLSCKVAVYNNGQSKGYGFVQFDRIEAAQKAVEQLNGVFVNNKKVYVGFFVPRRLRERNQANGSLKFTNVYVKNFSESITVDDLKRVFETFGVITSAVVMKDENGKPRCFGFLNFENPDSAVAAVEKLNGWMLDDKVLYVGRAKSKAERQAELKAIYQHQKVKRFERLHAQLGANLYCKNLDDSINEEKLRELFKEYGNITSCKAYFDQVRTYTMSLLSTGQLGFYPLEHAPRKYFPHFNRSNYF